MQMQMGLPDNIAMNSLDLSYDELTVLSQNRQAWKDIVNWNNADTSLSLHSPWTVQFMATTKTEEERRAVQEEWNKIFDNEEKQSEQQKRKRDKAKKR